MGINKKTRGKLCYYTRHKRVNPVPEHNIEKWKVGIIGKAVGVRGGAPEAEAFLLTEELKMQNMPTTLWTIGTKPEQQFVYCINVM